MAFAETTRRGFIKLASMATAATAVGLGIESNLHQTEKAFVN